MFPADRLDTLFVFFALDSIHRASERLFVRKKPERGSQLIRGAIGISLQSGSQNCSSQLFNTVGLYGSILLEFGDA